MTYFSHGPHLFHLTAPQLVTLIVDSLARRIVQQVNRTSILFQHSARYPRSISAILSYVSNAFVLDHYGHISEFYSESKRFFLAKALQYSAELEVILNIAPMFADSITLLASSDIRAVIQLFNLWQRQLVSLWINSPIEDKLMRTVAGLVVQAIDQLRFRLDDRFDSLLPMIRPLGSGNEHAHKNNQTFLLTWSKQPLPDPVDAH